MALTLVGGTGGLGLEIAKGLVTAADIFTGLKALVRSTTSDGAKQLQSIGWTLVQVDDFTDQAAIESALQGTKTIVSAFGKGDMVALETATIKAAKKAGVSLYVPSQFGVDYRRWGSSFPFMAGKGQVLQAAQAEGLPTLSVFVGFFSDFIFNFLADPPNGKARLIGNGGGKLSFTRRSDIGYVLAKALADPEYAQGGMLSMQGDNKTWKESLELLEEVTGNKLEIEVVDPQDALKQEQQLLEKGLKGDMAAFFGAFALHLLGEPARGNTGCDVSADAKSYGVKLETLEETLLKQYGSR